MNINTALRNDRLSASLTGLTVKEFNQLLILFTPVLIQALKERNPDRIRVFGGGRKGHLVSPADRLFAVLMFLKVYPTYDVGGWLLGGMEKSNLCRWIHFLLPVLQKVLGRNLSLPRRQIRSVEEFFELYPGAKDVFIDGTERRTQRPKNQKKQKKLYSGKKKGTTRKTIVVSDHKNKILVLTPTRAGRRHDKRLFDKDIGHAIPLEVTAWTDTGFKGIEHHRPNTMMPKKNTKLHKLTPEERLENKLISGIRILTEHAIAGIKRYGAATLIYRHKLPNLDDTFTLLSAGLWNFHLDIAK